jgi:predicted Na+-dependent transporter
MPVTSPVPESLLSIVAAATLLTIMFDLGLAIVPGEFRWVVQRPGLILKGLFSGLVAVPALAWIVVRGLDLPRAAAIGVVLMAISPGAPVALRRSLGAGSHRSFAPALQIAVPVLAVVSMPLSIAAFNDYEALRPLSRINWPNRYSSLNCRSASACWRGGSSAPGRSGSSQGSGGSEPYC